MDLLAEKPSIDLNDRSWVIHTRTEERPPARIARDTVIRDSMITDGCVIHPGALIEHSILAPGVAVHPKAKIRDSVILTDTVVEAGAVVERAIVDKRARIGKTAHLGSLQPAEAPAITMVGKNSLVKEGLRVEAGAIISTDVKAEDYPSDTVGAGDLIQTSRMPYED